MDIEGSNSLDAAELSVAFEMIGLSFDREEVEAMIARVDHNNNGTLGFEEFVELMMMPDAKPGDRPIDSLGQAAVEMFPLAVRMFRTHASVASAQRQSRERLKGTAASKAAASRATNRRGSQKRVSLDRAQLRRCEFELDARRKRLAADRVLPKDRVDREGRKLHASASHERIERQQRLQAIEMPHQVLALGSVSTFKSARPEVRDEVALAPPRRCVQIAHEVRRRPPLAARCPGCCCCCAVDAPRALSRTVRGAPCAVLEAV
eukprot:6565071-Prymnesium_polylepis.2